MAIYRDERPTHVLNDQEKAWNAPKFVGLLVATLIVSIGLIVAMANAAYSVNY